MVSSLRWDIILGGFGMFMFGISFMGDGLKAFAGDKLRYYIDKYTTNPFSALLIGIVITIIMQSSSASTAITIGLVRAGMMSLEQAAGIVMGANIGTTITSLIISMDISNYILYFVFLGGVIGCFAKKKNVKEIGNILLGFGLIFYGLNSMGDALSAIKDMPWFIEFAESMANNPFLSLFAGTVMTGLIQASGATIGVVQKMYAAGAFTFKAVLPFVFGANIGTTVTGVLAAVGGSSAAKRTAGIHTLFNIVGTTIGMLLLNPYANLIGYLTSIFGFNPEMQIALSHILFNTCTTIVFFPFLKQFCNLIRKIIPDDKKETFTTTVRSLDPKLAETAPSLAISATNDSIEDMSSIVRQDIEHANMILNHPGDEDDLEQHKNLEQSINDIDKTITEYLVNISRNQDLAPNDSKNIRTNLEVVKNLERVADLGMNLVEFSFMVSEKEESFSTNALKDMNNMYSCVSDMLNLSLDVYKNHDSVAFGKLEATEEKLDELENKARNKHFKRMINGECHSAIASSIYCDYLGTLERIGDHILNIAKATMQETEVDLSDDEFRVS